MRSAGGPSPGCWTVASKPAQRPSIGSPWSVPTSENTLLAGEGTDVALHSSRFLAHLQVAIRHHQVVAHVPQHPLRTDGRQVAFGQAVVGLQEVFDAIGLGQENALAEAVDKDFR